MSTWRPISPLPFWKRWLPECLHGPVRLLVQLAVLGLLVLSAVAFFYFMLAMRFDMDEVARLPAGTTFYDRKGVEIAAPGGSGRKLVKRTDLPDFLVKSLQAREDARFFDHHGVDVRGLVRATVRNLKDRDFTQGASTLSMQLARNSFKMKQKSLHRKFLEIALTLRVESRYTKDEILTHYLNRIYFGAGADGIEQAARTYFGKATRDLTDGECALIVGIIRGPHCFSPFRNLDAALEQRDQTLTRMVAMGFIDPPAATPSPRSPSSSWPTSSAKPRPPTRSKPSAANSTASSTTVKSSSAGCTSTPPWTPPGSSVWKPNSPTPSRIWNTKNPGPTPRTKTTSPAPSPPTCNTPPSPPKPAAGPSSP